MEFNTKEFDSWDNPDQILTTHATAFKEVCESLHNGHLSDHEIVEKFAENLQKAKYFNFFSLQRKSQYLSRNPYPTITKEMVISLSGVEDVASFGPYSFYPTTRQVVIQDGSRVQLSKQESRFFHPLIAFPKHILRKVSVGEVLGLTYSEDPKHLANSNLKRIRDRLGESDISKNTSSTYPYIQTIKSVGFMLCPADEMR